MKKKEQKGLEWNGENGLRDERKRIGSLGVSCKEKKADQGKASSISWMKYHSSVKSIMFYPGQERSFRENAAKVRDELTKRVRLGRNEIC